MPSWLSYQVLRERIIPIVTLQLIRRLILSSRHPLHMWYLWVVPWFGTLPASLLQGRLRFCKGILCIGSGEEAACSIPFCEITSGRDSLRFLIATRQADTERFWQHVAQVVASPTSRPCQVSNSPLSQTGSLKPKLEFRPVTTTRYGIFAKPCTRMSKANGNRADVRILMFLRWRIHVISNSTVSWLEVMVRLTHFFGYESVDFPQACNRNIR